MAECVRLNLVDIDLGWNSHGEPTKVDSVREESVVCYLTNVSLSLSLFPSLPLSLPPLPWDWGLRAVYGRSWR